MKPIISETRRLPHKIYTAVSSEKFYLVEMNKIFSFDGHTSRHSPAVCAGFIPITSLIIIALVTAGTFNSSAANFSTAVNGVLSGTLRLQQEKKNFTQFISLQIGNICLGL